MSEKVLLVDDENDFLEIMSERIKTRGMEVETCTSAEEALEIIKNKHFDAIILDYMMPGIDGMKALKEIKKRRPESQIILLTGHATIEKSVEAIKSGATDFLEKPANIEDLEKKIKDAKANRLLIVEKQIEERIKSIINKYGA